MHSQLEIYQADVIKYFDDVTFIDSKTGYECELKRTTETGCWCGYVRVPENHPYSQVNYIEVNKYINIHGDLTFGDGCWFGFDTSDANIDYIPAFSEMISQFHVTYKTYEFAKTETIKLAKQFFLLNQFQHLRN